MASAYFPHTYAHGRIYTIENGTASNPAYTFTGDTDTGLYRDAATPSLKLAVGGADALTVAAGAVTAPGAITAGSFVGPATGSITVPDTGEILFADTNVNDGTHNRLKFSGNGTSTYPQITFNAAGGPNTGIYSTDGGSASAGARAIHFAVDGVDALKVKQHSTSTATEVVMERALIGNILIDNSTGTGRIRCQGDDDEIQFGDDALVTTGSLSVGAAVCTSLNASSGTIQTTGAITDGVATLSDGALSSVTSVDCTSVNSGTGTILTRGTVQGAIISATSTNPSEGILSATGSLTVGGAANLNGGIACDTDKFTVANTTGNTVIDGTLSVGSGNFTVNDDGDITAVVDITASGNITAVDVTASGDLTGNIVLAKDKLTIGEPSASQSSLEIDETISYETKFYVWASTTFGRIACECYDWEDTSKATELALYLEIGSSDSAGGRVYSQWVYSDNYVAWSDDRCKHNEKILESALATINKLQVKDYLKTSEMYDADHTLTGSDVDKARREVGVIAQEINEIDELKDFVHLSEAHSNEEEPPMKYSVNYTGLFVYGLKAIQELSQQVDALTARVAQLESGT